MRDQNRSDWILAGIIFVGLMFFLIVIPAVTAWGVVTGRLEIETLDPVSCNEQIQEEIGGY